MRQNWGGVQQVPQYAKDLENWGYDHIWCTDENFQRNVYVVLSLVALNTEKVTLGTCVTNPYLRHPLMTAAAIGTVNELSGGRAILGIGAGSSILFEHHRIKRLYSPLVAIKEAVEVLQPILRGSTVTYQGSTMNFTKADLDFESKPVPIFIACRGPKLLQLAGELADGVIIGSLASKEGLRFALRNIKKGADRAGRDPKDIEIVFWSYLSMLDDEEKAKQNVKRIVISSMWSSKSILKYIGISDDIWKPIEEILKRGFSKGLTKEYIYEQAYKQLSDDVLDTWSVTGNPVRVMKRVKEIVSVGVDHFALIPFAESQNEIKDMQHQFAEIIIPQFK